MGLQTGGDFGLEARHLRVQGIEVGEQFPQQQTVVVGEGAA